MRINTRLSVTLRFLSFIAAICVVMIHSNTFFTVENPASWNRLFHEWFCCRLTGWAVPYFFLCSGFFFANSNYFEDGGFRPFLIKKVRGLVVPYFLWGVIAGLLVMPPIIANNVLKHQWVLSRTIFDCHGIWDFINSTFGILKDSPRALGVLWFVRDLIILFLLAPIWRLLASSRKSAWCLIGVVVAARYVGHGLISPSYFLLGIMLAVYLPRRWIIQSGDGESSSWRLPNFINYSFWIYCTHNIILSYILPSSHYAFGKSNLAIAVLTPTSVALAVLLSILLAKGCQRMLPWLWCSLNGGR